MVGEEDGVGLVLGRIWGGPETVLFPAVHPFLKKKTSTSRPFTLVERVLGTHSDYIQLSD